MNFKTCYQMVIKIFFSHEPLESNNKMFRQYRENFARKTSRKDNLYDVFWRTSVCSDPLLLKNVFKFKKNLRKREPFPQSVLDLLKPTGENSMN